MTKQAAGPLLNFLALDRSLEAPLHRQLYNELRKAILTGRLSGGERLPSTRTLASDLDVSRGTVVDAFLQLYAEGYVDGRIGSGTYVAFNLPAQPQRFTEEASRDTGVDDRSAPSLSRRFIRQQASAPVRLNEWTPPTPGNCAFMIGVPALDSFPRLLWGRMVSRLGRDIGSELLVRDKHTGHAPLRGAIAAYLGSFRGVRCTADQVIVVNGSQQAISLIAQVLLDPGDEVWMEEPGYFGAKGALLGAGANLVPVPVDHDGLSVDAGNKLSPNARAAFVTPSHQMPLGVTMSLSRRLSLLTWARTTNAWIIEDDYDSEFRYASRPLTALQGLDDSGRVLYTGTFSKVLFPGLRLGYLVVPAGLVEAFATARLFADMYSPILEQLLVTEFMEEGHFERHVRRMRSLYAERQAALVEHAKKHLGGVLDVKASESGMHLIGRLPAGQNDIAAQLACQRLGVRVLPLTRQFLSTPTDSGLLLGYAACTIREIEHGVRRISEALLPLTDQKGQST